MKSSLWTSALRIALFLLLLVGVLLACSREARISLLGVKMRYRPVNQSREKLILLLRINEGQEIQGQRKQAPVDASESSSLQAELEESTTSVGGSELDFSYRLTQMRSEQFAWRQEKSSKILDARWAAQVAPFGPLIESKPSAETRSPWLQSVNLDGWLAALWPGLSRSRVRPLSSWSAEVQVPLKVREFHDPLILQQRYTYHLARVFQEGRQTLAQIEWNGTVSSLSTANVTGQLSGSALIDLDRQVCIDGDFIIDQELHAPIEGLPGNPDEGIVFAWHQTQRGKIFRTGP
jgi:hypothetical protein